MRNYVKDMRARWPGYLNRAHRRHLAHRYFLEMITNIDPWVFWTGKRLP